MPAFPGSLAQRSASGAVWTILEMAGTQGISLISFAILAHFIQPRDFGLIGISYAAIFTMKSLFIDSVVFAVIRKSNATDIEYTTAFWLTLGFSACMSLSIYLSAPVAERLLHASGLASVMRAMSIILLFMGLARTHEMRLARHFQFRSLAVRALLGATLGGIAGAALAIRGDGVNALVIQQIVTSFLSLLFLWMASSWHPGLRISGNSAKEIFRFMLSIAPTSIGGAINQNADTLLVAAFFGPAATGLYGIGKRLRMALQTAAGTPINAVGLPALAEVQHDPERLRRVALRTITTIATVCLPIFIGASSIAPELVHLTFGPRWLQAAPVFSTLAFAGPFMVLQSFCDAVFTLKNRQIWSFYILLIYTGLAIGLFLLGRLFAFGNIALPFVLPFLAAFPVAAILVSRLTGLAFAGWRAALGPALISSILVFFVVRLLAGGLPPSDMIRLPVLTFAGAICYLALMCLIGRSAIADSIRIARMMINRRSDTAA